MENGNVKMIKYTLVTLAPHSSREEFLFLSQYRFLLHPGQTTDSIRCSSNIQER